MGVFNTFATETTKNLTNMKILSLLLSLLLATPVMAQLSALRVSGNQIVDEQGNRVVLHGVMDTPSPYFNNGRWGTSCNLQTASKCVKYFDQLFTAITDTAQGTHCDVFRLHLDPAWTNDASLASGVYGETGEADISQFSLKRLETFFGSVYFPIMQKALGHGLYVVVRPPGVCPANLKVGDYYQEYLKTVWNFVSSDEDLLEYQGQIMLELANEPVTVTGADGQASASALHDYFQPIVDIIRANGYTGIIWVPGAGYQSLFQDYATHPIDGYNIGYAAHVYPGWYGASDTSCDAQSFISQFAKQVPVVETNPVIVTEIDWSPEKEGEGKYNEFGQWVAANYGTWGTASTSKWGAAWKAVMDHYGNISMTLTGTSDYIDIDKYLADGTVTPAFDGMAEACAAACFQWYADYAKTDNAYPSFTRRFTADQGDGTYRNPILNADFPDPDVIRVGDWYYMSTTTMFHVPGATILKSRDLVNWEYCSNPLTQVDDDDFWNLANGKNHYAQGQWASSLRYHNGTFYLYFLLFGDNGGGILLTATDPEGEWTMRKINGSYYDASLLFDGDDIYIVHGINNITVTKLDKNFNKVSEKLVIDNGTNDVGLEGSHFYKIGDYYYIYSTYGGTEGSQTIFRSTSPMGDYEECSGRLMANQHIHQGALVETQTGEWWTVLFKDEWPTGRLPYLEPVTWSDGWPVIGNSGRDVCANNKAYQKPDVGTSWPVAWPQTNDVFCGTELGKQWQWSHKPQDNLWSLTANPGHLRLYTGQIAASLTEAQNSLTQRAFNFANSGLTEKTKYMSYATIKLDATGMKDGDRAGLAVFDLPYTAIYVERDGSVLKLCAANGTAVATPATVMAETSLGATGEVYLRAVINFNASTATLYYSTDNMAYTQLGSAQTIQYSMTIFEGQRFMLFNYPTKQQGGFVDIDWFSTEPSFAETDYYSPELLTSVSDDDLTVADISVAKTDVTLLAGATYAMAVTCTAVSGRVTDVSAQCAYTVSDESVCKVNNGTIVARSEGTATVTATYTDAFGNSRSATTDVRVQVFPLTEDLFNASISGKGIYEYDDEDLIGVLKTAKNGFGGWKYTNGADLSASKYIVISLARKQATGGEFRLYDTADYNSATYYRRELGAETTVKIPLSETGLDLDNIFFAGFWSNGTGYIAIENVTLSDDGETGITNASADAGRIVGSEYYTVSGVRVNGSYSGIVLERQRRADGTTVTVKYRRR